MNFGINSFGQKLDWILFQHNFRFLSLFLSYGFRMWRQFGIASDSILLYVHYIIDAICVQ